VRHHGRVHFPFVEWRLPIPDPVPDPIPDSSRRDDYPSADNSARATPGDGLEAARTTQMPSRDVMWRSPRPALPSVVVGPLTTGRERVPAEAAAKLRTPGGAAAAAL
jgi:hypothetical protein